MSRLAEPGSADLPVTNRVPYTIHSSPHNVRTESGDVLTVLKVTGIGHEAADDADIQGWHEVLCGLLRNLSSEPVAVYIHTLRVPRNEYPGGVFDPDFAGDLNDKYKAKLRNQVMMVNNHYLTIVLRPPSKIQQVFNFGVKKTQEGELAKLEDANRRLDELSDMAMATLARYSPQRLSIYEYNGFLCSETLEFLAEILNGEWQRIPLAKGQVRYAMCSHRLSFGADVLEVRGPTGAKLGAVLAVNEYQTERTEPGHLNLLLTLPFPYVLTQSYAMLPRQHAMSWMQKQQRLLLNAGDQSVSQIESISAATDDLASNRIVFGDHDLSMLVLADTNEELVKRIAMVKAALSESGFVVIRESGTVEAAYFANLPGNFKLRPRPSAVSSRNFIGFTGFHNYPNGRATGNQWGPALSLLKTTSGTPYYFNFHLPPTGKRGVNEEDADERVPGHTLVIGPTGAGKTVTVGFLIAQAEKYSPTVFVFDKDRGMEIQIRAMGGKYEALRNGQPTGFNPCAMPDTAANRDFLLLLLRVCAGGEFTPAQERQLSNAVNGLFGLPFEDRRLRNIIDFFDATDPHGVAARLRKWVGNGPLAWMFDNEHDLLTLDGTRHFGFDMTEFLDNPDVLTPGTLYLFHRMEQLIDGRRFILAMDEFWKLLSDERMANKALDAVKTYRKRNAIAVFATQSPADVLNSSISRPLLEQCVTQLYLPNPKARRDDYLTGFNLTEREYQIIRSDMVEQNLRGFLLKQGANSTVCELNLQGFDDELAVLSGTSTSVEWCHRAIAKVGDNPELWLPEFQAIRRNAR